MRTVLDQKPMNIDRQNYQFSTDDANVNTEYTFTFNLQKQIDRCLLSLSVPGEEDTAHKAVLALDAMLSPERDTDYELQREELDEKFRQIIEKKSAKLEEDPSLETELIWAYAHQLFILTQKLMKRKGFRARDSVVTPL